MGKLIYHIGKLSEDEQFRIDFEDALSRSIEDRIELGFIPMKLPVMNDAPYRIFDTIKEYRKWTKENLPEWLGYYCKDD
ncbi:MAG: hypothetical protein HY097_02150 [Nitrospinae bacterium]|nr:hypothetical protein [Nitrospinota bacterium]